MSGSAQRPHGRKHPCLIEALEEIVKEADPMSGDQRIG